MKVVITMESGRGNTWRVDLVIKRRVMFRSIYMWRAWFRLSYGGRALGGVESW